MRRAGQLLAGLVAAALITALVVVVPWALVRFVGWPLPSEWPSLEELRRAVQLGVSDDTVIKSLAVVVWIAWAQVATALVIEVAGVVRRGAVGARFLLPGMQEMAGRLVAGVLLIGAALGPRPTETAAPLETALVAAAVEPEVDASPEPVAPDVQHQPATATVTTVARDSWWKLAERHLGDGMRWRELRDLNLGRTVDDGGTITAETEHLGVGWDLLVPANDDGRVAGQEVTPAGDEAVQAHVVEAGENFWKIAEQTLTEAWGQAPTDDQIAPYWQELVKENRNRLLPPGDPDLIYPGQRIVLPLVPPDQAGATPGAPDLEASPPAPPTDTRDDERPDGGRVPATGSHGAPDRPVPRATPGARPTVEAGGSSGWTGALSAPDESFTEVPVQEEDVDDAETAWGTPPWLAAGVAATGLLGAGVVAVWRRRNRLLLERNPAGLKLPTPAPEVVEEVGRLEAAAPDERALDDLASLLATIPEDAHPVLVTTHDDGHVSILFDDHTEVPPPPDPWTYADDGDGGPVGWTATLGSRGTGHSIGLPLLITLGRLDDRNVLANVGAMRTLAVQGDDGVVANWLRTMAIEVATSRVAGPVDVVVAGDDRLSSLDQVRATDSLRTEVDSVVDEKEGGVILEDRTARLLIAHGDADGDIEIPDGLDGMLGLVTAGIDDNQWAFTIGRDGTGQLRLSDGAVADLVLPHVDAEVIDDELERQAEQLEAQATTAINGQPVDPDVYVSEPAARTDRPAEPFCEVRLLGRMDVIRDGQHVRGLGQKTKEALAYIATHPDGVTGERFETAVWTGGARSGSQRVRSVLNKIRRALGDGPDGEPLLPDRKNGDDLIRMNHTATDIDRALALLWHARSYDGEEQVAHLTEALDLIRGEPLKDLPVSWGTDIAARATVPLQQAAIDVARALREAGDHDGAEHAIRQGLALCDPYEPLYVEWANLEAAQGRHDEIERLWARLCDRYDDAADEDGSVLRCEPNPTTRQAFVTLAGRAD